MITIWYKVFGNILNFIYVCKQRIPVNRFSSILDITFTIFYDRQRERSNKVFELYDTVKRCEPIHSNIFDKALQSVCFLGEIDCLVLPPLPQSLQSGLGRIPIDNIVARNLITNSAHTMLSWNSTVVPCVLTNTRYYCNWNILLWVWCFVLQLFVSCCSSSPLAYESRFLKPTFRFDLNMIPLLVH